MCIQLITTYTSCPSSHAHITCTQSCPLPYFALPYHRLKAEYVFVEGFCPICDASYGTCWRSTSTRARRSSCGAVMEGGGYREEVDSEEGTTIVADSKPAPGWSAAVNGGGAVAVPVVMRDKATQTEGEKWRKTYKQRRDRAWNQRKVKKRAGEMTAATNDADNDDDESQQPVTSYSEGDKHPSNRAIKKAIREKNKEVRQQQQQQTVNGAKREEEGVESGGRAGEAAAAAAALRGGGNKREGGKKENAKTRRNWAWKARDKERARGKKEALERGEGLK